MSRPVRFSLSPLQAAALLRHLQDVATMDPHLQEAIRAVAGAMASKPRKRQEPPSFLAVAADPKPFRRARLAKVRRSKAEKRESRADIREVCLGRADGWCECGCGGAVTDAGPSRATLDHFFGRGKAPETAENCWILREDCHDMKTRNRPDATTWLRRFAEHCRKYGYARALHKTLARVQFVETRDALPAAPKVRP